MIIKLQKGSGDVIVSLCIQMVSMKSVTLKIFCTVHHSDLTEGILFQGNFNAVFILQQMRKKCVLVFLEGECIILKYTFTSVVSQLALK